MKEPGPEGYPGAGMRGEDYFDLMMDEYYQYHGIDAENRLQTRDRLEELDLKDVADILERENALSLAKPRTKEEVLKEAIRKAQDFKV